MKNSVTWTVVGGDGLIGRRIAGDARRFADSVVSSSRRPNAHPGSVFADLTTGDFNAVIATAPDVAFLCAAMTSMKACRDNPELSYRVNVTETVSLASQLVKQGAFVVFLSSNAVFNGSTPQPDEHHPREPVTEYGVQKACAEQELSKMPGADEHIAIVRLSKVLSPDTGMAAEFLRRFRARESCTAFDDLRMAPISLCYAADGLLAVASRKLPGTFHLSGAEELSYAEFARRLASHVGADPESVKAVPSRRAVAEVLFSPRFPALGMKRTRELLGIEPEPMDRVLDELSKTAG